MDIRAFVDASWAEFFGVPIDAMRRMDTFVVTGAPGLEGYRGLYLLRISDACVIGAPDDVADLVRERTAGLSPDEVFTPDRARTVAGDDATLVLGPSIHSYLDAETFVAPPTCDARRLSVAERATVDAFRSAIDESEWSEGGFGPDPDVTWGAFEDGRLVAMGNMTDFAGRPADVGLVTHPDVRRRGYGARLAGAMIVAALPEISVIRYRALEVNVPSRRVAQKLGFIDHGSNIAVRLHG